VNKTNPFFFKLVILLLHIIKFIQPPTKQFRFPWTHPSSLKPDGLLMRTQELIPAKTAILSFNRKPVHPIPGNSSRLILGKRGRLIQILILCMAFSLFMIPLGQVLAASFTVNSTADSPDLNPGDGLCKARVNGQDVCTLRAAILEANASPGADTITVPAGVYELGIPVLNDDLPETGDWDIHGPVTIVGAGASSTIIDGSWPIEGADPEARGMDRLFEIHPGAGNVTFKNLTLREAFSSGDGGAIQNWSSGLLRLENIHVKDNLASGSGGGLNNADPIDYDWITAPLTMPKSGRVEIVGSTFSGNSAGGGGAAINNVSTGTISIMSNSQIVDNPGQMIPDPLDTPPLIQNPQNPGELIPDPTHIQGMIPAPGVYQPDSSPIVNEAQHEAVGTINISNSTVARNYATHDGAGIYNGGTGTITITSSTISDNTTEAAGGGIYAVGGTITISDSTISKNKAHDGGGLYSDGASDLNGLRSRVTITGSAIKDNVVEAGGGGISNGGDAHLAITDTTISGNKAGDAGGGLAHAGRASMTLTRVTFSGNSTHGEGGGAWTSGERQVIITASTFTDNHAGTPEVGDLPPVGPGPIGKPGDANFDAMANVSGGGGLYTEGGPVTITGSTFSDNTATDEGGGISIDNFGDFVISDSTVSGNRAGADGGGIENSGMRVTFERLLVTGNRATLDGGGIYNSSSGEFFILDSTIQLNSAQDGGGLGNLPDASMIVRRSLFYRNVARVPVMTAEGTLEDGGYGGGLFSMADGDALMENSTFSYNTAGTGGGGIFHDADGEFRINNVTVWRNSAPVGGGIGVVESDFVPTSPPSANISFIARNSIIAGSLDGGSCDYYITSEGGNVDGGGHRTPPAVPTDWTNALPIDTACFLTAAPTSDPAGGVQTTRDRRSTTFMLDALADNGGPTLTHALRPGSLAIDSSIGACLETDQRGITRPQNGRCDSGAFEYVGPLPVPDDVEPDTEFLTMSVGDDGLGNPLTLFSFTGSDDLTAVEELQYECRLIEIDLTEAPEPIAPWEPVPPELMWMGCTSPWSYPAVEEGLFSFEVRAIDRAGNIDSTPAIHLFDATDTTAPETIIAEKPPLLTNSRSATFTFSAVDNATPPTLFEYECRLDNRDPDLWLECVNPTIYSNLTTGPHTVEVRAYDVNGNVDPTPARYTWTVGQPFSCDQANITLTAVADGWVDEVNPLENYMFSMDLTVRSSAVGDPTAVPPEPVIGENARALVRFVLPTDAPADCELESATLRLYAESPTEGRTLEAIPLAGSWQESTLTWANQPGTIGTSGVTTASGLGYREWDVTAHVLAMLESGVSHGWQIRDANENDPEGGDQSFASRELLPDPPEMTLPELVLLYKADLAPPPELPTLPTGTPPTTVSCGQVITQSTLVGNDLFNCPGEGLIIGASNIVLDLNGHTIDGPDYLLGNISGQEEGFPAAIRSSGHTNVIIRNGTVQQFGYGVLLTGGTTRHVVENLTVLRHAMSGIELFDADDGRTGNTIRNNILRDNELGITIFAGSQNSVVSDNVIHGSLGEALHIQFSSGHLVEGNEMVGIPTDPNLDSDGGVLLEGSSNNIFLSNEIRDTGDAGIVISLGSNNNRIENNVMYRNGDAGVIIYDSDRNQIINLVAHQESDGGVVLNNAHHTVVRDSDLRYNPSGVESSNSNDLLIENNDASDSLQTGLEIGNGVDIIIRNNIANRNGGAGISMEGAAFDTLGNPVGGAIIEGNTANENLESGLNVADGGHLIRDNTAHNNAGFGILAGENPVPGEPPGPPNPSANVDGGGNVASGNGEPEQCAGVVCESGTAPPLVGPDTTAPVTTITSGPDWSGTGPRPSAPTSFDSTARFTFTASDLRDNGSEGTPITGMVFECRLDPPPDPLPEIVPPDPEPPTPGAPPDVPDPVEGEGWAECISPVYYYGLQPGEHHFEVRALDQSEPPNKDLTPETYDWVLEGGAPPVEETGPDTLAPETRIVSGPPTETTSSSATFHFAGTDNMTMGLNLSFECQIDGEGYLPCTSPRVYVRTSGPHTFHVRAVDAAGNVDPTPASFTWAIFTPPPDTTAPDTFLDSAPDPVTVLTNATFTFSSDDPTATFECVLDDGALESCASPMEYTGLLTGEHDFVVQAKDPAGNVDPTPITYVWTISSTPVARTVFCGQVLTQSTRLNNDLTDCLWDGLVIGANGITIDLNGHTIDGKGIAAGIRNDGYDFVTIKNGFIREFDYGVMLNPNTENSIVESITMEQNQEAGVALGQVPHPTDPLQPLPAPAPYSFQSGVRNNIIRNNTLLSNDQGVWLTNNTRGTLVSGNFLAGNAQYGVFIERSGDNRVESNEISGSSGAAVELKGSSNNTIKGNNVAENGGGVHLGITDSSSGSLPSNDNLVEANTIVESGGDAIEISGDSISLVTGNQLIDNIAHHSNGDGVSLSYADDTLIRGNDFTANKAGISLKNSSDNVIEENDASGSEGDGITLEAQSVNNDLIRNISSRNIGDGIYVGDETSGDAGMWIEGNVTSNNQGYGIFVPKVSHTLKDNIANDNTSWGIWVSEGSNGRVNIDAGGNRAMGNLGPLDPMTLQPLQCYSIQCSGGPPVANDQIAPDTMLLETPPDLSTTTLATFHFIGTDNASSVSFECKLDGGAFTACSSPAGYTVGLGAHTFEVRAIDTSGNVDATPATHSWWVNPAPAGAPETTITSGPDLTTVAINAQFQFSSSESGSIFECALDGAAFAPCSSPKSYTALAVGAHTFQVRATDTTALTDASPAAYSWTIKPAPVASEIVCGQIVMQSILVTNDLIDCGGHGLVIGAHGITIDLNGHYIDGIGLDSGILNNGFDSVTITNGTVTEFDYGITLNPGTSLNIVDNMRVELNQEAGIALAHADQNGRGNTIRNNTVESNLYGIALFSNTQNNLIYNNALGGNTDGIRLEFASNNRIEANEISSSAGDAIVMEGGGDNTVVDNSITNSLGFGIAAGAELLPSNNNLIKGNTISEGKGGISVIDSTGVQILSNTVNNTDGAGVSLDLARNTLVRGNDLRSNQGGVYISESSNNRVEFNNASGSLGTGIEIGSLSPNNIVSQNNASSNGGEGIVVEDTAPAGAGNVIELNTADGNGGDGIAMNGVGHTLTGNIARLNGGWGIYAASGAINGGNNQAAGNMEPAQCFGITCNIGTVAGGPETWIESGPVDVDPGTSGIQSNSRNASFTYMGSDTVTPLHELVFECRIDSTNDLAWQDCEYPAEMLNLSAGQHTFEVRAIDMLGVGLADPSPAKYVWTYVPLPFGIAPEVMIDMKPEAETWVLDALFTFHSNEPDVTFECKVDFFPYEPCGFEGASYMMQGAFEWGFAEEEAGPHTFYVRVIDFEGNVSDPATYTWMLLGINTIFLPGPAPESTGYLPPETPLDPATGSETASTTAIIAFEANIADAIFECSLDLQPFVPCSSPVTYEDLLAGDHLLRVIATDLEGNTQLEASEYEWSIIDPVDSSAPETSIERAPANNSSSTLFEFTGVDDLTPLSLLRFQCRIDSTNELDWFDCVSPFNLLDLFTYADPEMAPGQHTFEVRAVDSFEPQIPDPTNPNFDGNPDPTPATHTWTAVADSVRPTTGILSGPSGTVGELDIPFEFFGADNATPLLELTFECSLDGAPFESCSSPESLGTLLPGEHTFAVRAVDLALNADLTPATRTWTVAAAPVTTITSGPAGRIVDGGPFSPPSNTESAIFVFSADQPGPTFECSLDGAEFFPCTSPRAYWVVQNGTHDFQVRATNPQGVIELEPQVYQWAVELGPDVTRPNTQITSGPSGIDQNTVATFTFTGSDNRTPEAELVFECALDGTAYNSCTSPDQWSDLVRGTHVLLVRARDAAGNYDATPARYEWIVSQPPTAIVLSGPDEITESHNATFTFTSDVPGSSFECWLDGPKGPCTSPVTYTNIPNGAHIFAVLPVDPHGTTGLEWAEYEWIIGDMTAPITIITSGPDIESGDPIATFEFTSNEPDVIFECSLDGGTLLPCTSPLTYPRVNPGAHHFEVQASHPITYDPFTGEPIEPFYDPVPSSYDWTVVDLIPPDTELRYGPPAQTSSITAYFAFLTDDPTAEIECSLDWQGFSTCESPIHIIEDLLPGQHVLQARARDLVGHVDPTPVMHTWEVIQAPSNTPAGTNVTVTVQTADGSTTATLNFATVSIPGATTIDKLTGGPSLPPGYSVAGAGFFDINTTADGEPETICLSYNPAAFESPGVRLLHFDGSTWVDITTSNDPLTGKACGLGADFGLYSLASGSEVIPLATITSGPDLISESGNATFTFLVDMPDAMAQCSIDGMPYVLCTSPVTYTYLETGSHSFNVQAIGLNGELQLLPSLYEWEVILGPDTAPPDTRIVRGPPPVTSNFISFFEFTGTDDQTLPIDLEFECLLDGVLLGSCSSILTTPTVPGVGYEVEVLSPGQHSFQVRAMDEMGNVDPTPATRTWVVSDLSGPDTSIELGPESETTATGGIFEFIGEEELTGEPVFEFECSLDNADFTPCSSPHEVFGLAPGSHVMQVRAKDPDGNVDISPDFYEWLILGPIDTTPPDTFIVNTPPNNESGPDVIFGFSANEFVENFECMLDNNPWEGCDAVYELIGLPTGSHTIRVRAFDMAEIPNVDPTPASYTWTVVGEPETTILNGPDAISASLSATFTFTSDQANATFQCSVDGSLFVPCTSPYIAGPLIQDTHTFEVQAMNQYVNIDGEPIVDLTPAIYEWEVLDLTPPETEILAVTLLGPTDLIEPNSLRFEFSGSDNGTVYFELEFQCSLDGGPFESCDWPMHYILLEELPGGDHVLLVRAVDAFDNADPTPAEYSWTTQAAPITTILSGPAPEVDSTEATFTFSAEPSGGTFECSLDLAPFTPCSNPVTFTGIAYGEHELEVRSRSADGMAIEIQPAVWSWVSGDMTPPVVTIHTGPAIATTDATATFTFSADDPAAAFQCSLDGGPLTFCTSPVTFAEEHLRLANGSLAGPHTLSVNATKPHLLVEGVEASWEWTVEDHTAPETTISTNPSAEIGLNTPASFTFSSNEPDATFECALDPILPFLAEYSACAAPPENSAEFGGLLAGEHTLYVRAVDPSLNTDASPASLTWTVVGPALTTITANVPEAPAITSETSATLTFSADQPGVTFMCSLDGADFLPCTSPVSFTELTYESHTFEVQSTNRFQVVEEPPVAFAWTVALPEGAVEPETVINSTPLDQTTETSATFTFSSDLPGSFACSLDGDL
jgi:CSLREA domain-containing protein